MTEYDAPRNTYTAQSSFCATLDSPQVHLPSFPRRPARSSSCGQLRASGKEVPCRIVGQRHSSQYRYSHKWCTEKRESDLKEFWDHRQFRSSHGNDLHTYATICEGEGPCLRMRDCLFSTTFLYASSAFSTRVDTERRVVSRRLSWG